ncbi:MAG: hypothetical protein GY854_04810 [Deltaproteobacteria bacterium]|nr:hypothetical protein [Deltaproteobacteria bacterium]
MSNQNARFDAIVAFVEPGTPSTGTFEIDRFVGDKYGRVSPPPPSAYNTIDWSWYQPSGSNVSGHYFANKAPGTILIGASVYRLLYTIEGWAGIRQTDPKVTEINLYLINLVVSVLFGALGIVFFRRLLLLSGASEQQALFISLTLAFATMLFPYNTQMWGHPTAAAFSILALYAAVRATNRWLFLSGMFAGLVVLTDYLGFLTVLILGIYALISQPKRCLLYVLGGVMPLLIFMVYHLSCFGSAFSLATDYTNQAFLEKDRFLGLLGAVKVDSLLALLFSRYRGLLVQMPVLVFSISGIVIWLIRRRTDKLGWLCLAGVLLYLLVNASFNGWHGGATACARYQILALPFWVLCLKAIPWRGAWRIGLIVVAAISAGNMLTVAAVSPTVPDWHESKHAAPPEYYNPFWVPDDTEPATQPSQLFYDSVYGWTYDQFAKGNLAAAVTQPYYKLDINQRALWHPTNAGLLLGLKGHLSLVPLAIVSIVVCTLLFLMTAGGAKKKTNDLT